MYLNSKGLALIVALGIIALLMLLIMIGLNFTSGNISLSYHILDNTRAFYFAEAGIQRAIYKIKNSDFEDEDWNFAGQTVTISIAGSGPYTVVSDCTYKSANKQIQTEISSTGKLIEWQQLK